MVTMSKVKKGKFQGIIIFDKQENIASQNNLS